MFKPNQIKLREEKLVELYTINIKEMKSIGKELSS